MFRSNQKHNGQIHKSFNPSCPSAALSAIELGPSPGNFTSIALYTLKKFKFVNLLHLSENLLYKLQQNAFWEG